MAFSVGGYWELCVPGLPKVMAPNTIGIFVFDVAAIVIVEQGRTQIVM